MKRIAVIALYFLFGVIGVALPIASGIAIGTCSSSRGNNPDEPNLRPDAAISNW